MDAGTIVILPAFQDQFLLHRQPTRLRHEYPFLQPVMGGQAVRASLQGVYSDQITTSLGLAKATASTQQFHSFVPVSYYHTARARIQCKL